MVQVDGQYWNISHWDLMSSRCGMKSWVQVFWGCTSPANGHLCTYATSGVGGGVVVGGWGSQREFEGGKRVICWKLWERDINYRV